MSEPVDGPVQNGVEMGPGHGGGHGLPPLTQSLSQSSSHSSSHITHSSHANQRSHRDTEESSSSHPMNIDADSTEGPSPNFGLASANSSSAQDIKPDETNAKTTADQSIHPNQSSHGDISSSLSPYHSLEGLHNSNLAKRQGLPSGPMVPSSTGAASHLDTHPQPAFNLLNASLLKHQLGVSPSSVQNPPTLLSTMSTLDTAAVPSTHPTTAYSQSPMQLTSPVIPLIPPNVSASNPVGMPPLQPLQGLAVQPNVGLPTMAPNAQTTTIQSSQPTSEFADMKHPYQVEPINTTSVGISTIGSGHEAIPVIISTTTTTITTTTITPIDPSQVPSAMALASAGVVPNGHTLPFMPSGTSVPGSLPFPIIPNLHQMQSQSQSPTSASSFNFSEGAVAATKNIKPSSTSSISSPAGADVGTQKKELDARGEAT